MITVRHLSKVYTNGPQSLAVLKDVNGEVDKGEVISIIGPSGTGKSTFLRCLNLLEKPTGGEILVDGDNILDKKTDIIRSRTFDAFFPLLVISLIYFLLAWLLGLLLDRLVKTA